MPIAYLAATALMTGLGFVAGRMVSHRSINMRDVIGVAVILGFLGSLGVLFGVPIPKQNEQLIVYMLGQLSGFAAGIVAYHYGQKAGDVELDKARVENTGKLADAVTAAVAAPAPPASSRPDGVLKPDETARAAERA